MMIIMQPHSLLAVHRRHRLLPPPLQSSTAAPLL
jgi:hypothetical protein